MTVSYTHLDVYKRQQDYIPMAAGFLLKKEIDALSAAVVHPKTPMAAIIGGAKVTDKISVISNLLPKVDVMIIGGGMANAFIKAQGCNIGSSLFEEGQEAIATDLVMEARVAGAKLLTPIAVSYTHLDVYKRQCTYIYSYSSRIARDGRC